MIIKRVLHHEIARHHFLVLGVLLGIALSNRFVVFLAQAAHGAMPLSLVTQVVLLTIPELLNQLLILSFYLSCLLVFSGLYATNEMTALTAAGVAPSFFQRVVLSHSLLWGALLLVMSLWGAPQAHLSRSRLLAKSEYTGLLNSLKAGYVHSLDGGRVIFFMKQIQGSELQDVFIAERAGKGASPGSWTILSAERAEVSLKLRDQYQLEMHQGRRTAFASEGVLVSDFAHFARSLNAKPEIKPNSYKEFSLTELRASSKRRDKVELAYRYLAPLGLPILSLTALHLSPVAFRQSRFKRFLPAILLYLVYTNVFLMLKHLLLTKSINPYGAFLSVQLLWLLGVHYPWRQLITRVMGQRIAV